MDLLPTPEHQVAAHEPVFIDLETTRPLSCRLPIMTCVPEYELRTVRPSHYVSVPSRTNIHTHGLSGRGNEGAEAYPLRPTNACGQPMLIMIKPNNAPGRRRVLD